jgi:hypothetical protein
LRRAIDYVMEGSGIVNALLEAVGGWKFLPPELEVYDATDYQLEVQMINFAYAGNMIGVVTVGSSYVGRLVTRLRPYYKTTQQGKRQ